jgi:ABC-type multidrug transport system ATPase subunit
MFFLPSEGLSNSEILRFHKYIKRIKRNYHTILMFSGDIQTVSECDHILMIDDDFGIKFGSEDALIKSMPQSGGIITLELVRPDYDMFKKLSGMNTLTPVEDRHGESFRLFLLEDKDKVIPRLLGTVGFNLYNLKVSKASLAEYSEFMKLRNYQAWIRSKEAQTNDEL